MGVIEQEANAVFALLSAYHHLLQMAIFLHAQVTPAVEWPFLGELSER
jgi:hypothetical protein